MGIYRKTATFQTSLVASATLNGGINIINKKDYKFYLAAGGGLMLLQKNREIQNNTGITNNVDYGNSETKLGTKSYNINLSAGVVVKKMLLWSCLNFPAQVSNGFYAPMHSSIQFGIGYKLN